MSKLARNEGLKTCSFCLKSADTVKRLICVCVVGMLVVANDWA